MALMEPALSGSTEAEGYGCLVRVVLAEKHIKSIVTRLDLLPERDTNRQVQAVLAFLDERG